MKRFRIVILGGLLGGLILILVPSSPGAELIGTVVDDATGDALPCRVYVRDEQGKWLFVESAAAEGSALPYREQWVPMANSVERHTTISAHPFRIELPPGKYAVTLERGKEYFPLTRDVRITDQPRQLTFRLVRWVNMASRGWYSGETHVHRRVRELPNVQLAEDLNVAFPVTFWTINDGEAPGLAPSPLRRQGPSPYGPRRDHGTEIRTIDPTHVFYPRNTEYEIFRIGGKPHTLGAVFVLNHRSRFRAGMPPVAEIAAQAHREGALLDLDKHSWPWAMMLVPIAKVDLYELSNNSVWRTEFGFRRASVPPADYMTVERDARGLTERGWLNYGFENYYALLNCGFRLQPTAGTASGVHPVPLGYSRVYVHVGAKFSGADWLDGLRNGRSFVTTGPMLFSTLNEKHPGTEFRATKRESRKYQLRIEALSERPLAAVELIVNGETTTITGRSARQENGGFAWRGHQDVSLSESSWVAVRCFEPNGKQRVRFAHTAPWHVVIGGEKVRPRRREINYLLHRIDTEIARSREVLAPAALEEFRRARRIYAEIAKRAR